MLDFVSKPKNFTPIHEGIVFVVESDEQCDFAIEIVNKDSGEVVGCKSISDTTIATVDIAPYIASLSSSLLPERGVCRLQSAPQAKYYIRVNTDMDSEVSDTVVVSNNLEKPKSGVNSIFAPNRKISYGEDDDVRIYAVDRSSVRAQIVADNGQSVNLELYSQTGAVELHIATAEFSSDIKELTVDISCDNVHLQRLVYSVVPRYEGSVRLMWVSAAGNWEHYTFPVTVESSMVIEKRRLSSHLTGEVVSTVSTKRKRLCSQNEAASVREALATVVSSTNVWMEGEQLTEVRVLEGEVVISKFGTAGHVVVTLEYDGKEVVQ